MRALETQVWTRIKHYKSDKSNTPVFPLDNLKTFDSVLINFDITFKISYSAILP